MDAYTGFSRVYDLFMDNVPYDEWAENIIQLLSGYGVESGIVAELGCGTGKMTRRLSGRFDMIGIDNAPEMLSIAREETTDEGILYLLQDMREFELYGTVAAAVSVCDSMNYITEEKDLLEVFRLVSNYLDPGGIFLFDLNTPYKYRELLGENTFAENRDEGSFIWENYFDEDTGINEYDLTLYIEEEEGVYSRWEETHFQRAYEPETIVRLLVEAGLHFVTLLDADTLEAPTETTERIYVVAQECQKGGAHIQFA